MLRVAATTTPEVSPMGPSYTFLSLRLGSSISAVMKGAKYERNATRNWQTVFLFVRLRSLNGKGSGLLLRVRVVAMTTIFSRCRRRVRLTNFAVSE